MAQPPNDRRIIWGAHVVPQISYTAGNAETREEGTTVGISDYTDYKLDTTIAKRFGGKGSVDINSNQADDGWVSFFSPIDATWDLRSTTDSGFQDFWEEAGGTGEFGVEACVLQPHCCTNGVWDNTLCTTDYGCSSDAECGECYGCVVDEYGYGDCVHFPNPFSGC